MPVHPLAGKSAPPELLVDVPRLVAAYYNDPPDPDDPVWRPEPMLTKLSIVDSPPRERAGYGVPRRTRARDLRSVPGGKATALNPCR